MGTWGHTHPRWLGHWRRDKTTTGQPASRQGQPVGKMGGAMWLYLYGHWGSKQSEWQWQWPRPADEAKEEWGKPLGGSRGVVV